MIGTEGISGRFFKPLERGLLSVTDALFPAYCLSCGRRTEEGRRFLCKSCFDLLPRDLPESDYYGAVARLAGLSPFAEYRSDLLFSRFNASRLLLHQIKYRDCPEIAYRLAKAFASGHRAKGHFSDVSIILPIPLAPGRMRQRGYNQSDYIARGLSEGLGVPVRSDLLARRESTGSQTGRGKSSRWEELEGLFYLPKPSEVRDRRLLICDDLLTSGSTLLHAAGALLSSETPPESLSYYTLFLNFVP
ncbi:MAG: ComF family protein [Bacteroidales bacterium]|nr:ComF family protein [Bacteroidales bacterium]